MSINEHLVKGSGYRAAGSGQLAPANRFGPCSNTYNLTNIRGELAEVPFDPVTYAYAQHLH